MYRKIIILSPQRHVAHLVGAIVRHEPTSVVWCSAVDQMLDDCKRLHPDLVIILSLTHFVNGCGLVESIRESVGRNVAIFVIGWHQSERMVLSLLESGVTQYMTFPISISRLRNKMMSRKQINL